MNKTSLITRIVEDLKAAFMLLTRIPVRWNNQSPPDLNRCLWAYPVVGMVVALIGICVYGGSAFANFPVEVSVLLSIAVMIVLTGAFHEDGLADTLDGFGGGAAKEQKLDIMRDSRIGTYGGLGLIIIIGLKVVALWNMSYYQFMTALLIGASLSRFMILIILTVLPPAREGGLSVNAGKPSNNAIISGLCVPFLFSFSLMDLKTTLIVIAVSVMFTLLFSRLVFKQVGGFSGDVLGATQQFSEVVVYLTLVSLWSGV